MAKEYEGQSIIFSEHAQGYIPLRGYHPHEVDKAVRESSWNPAERNRLEARMDFPYHSLWNGKFYETKQVRPVFVVEGDTITVVTVYTYFF
jgi:hypothetical protein